MSIINDIAKVFLGEKKVTMTIHFCYFVSHNRYKTGILGKNNNKTIHFH